LDKTDFARLEDFAARLDLPKSAAHKFKPSTLALVLDLPPCTIRLPGAKFDDLVADIARQNKIETVGLETTIEQLEALDGLPRKTERDLLISVVRQADRWEDITETEIARYTEGDIGGLLAWLRSADLIPGVAEARIRPAFADRLITLPACAIALCLF
jgi:uncharacterized protein YbaP (TraB family)